MTGENPAARLAGTGGVSARCGLGKPPTGQPATKAGKQLTTAAATSHEMGMDFWLEKADAALDGIG